MPMMKPVMRRAVARPAHRTKSPTRSRRPTTISPIGSAQPRTVAMSASKSR
jgi:hypothetical protein